ncbi:hypothetical protein D3C87_1673760 [compost metagenome]
MQATNVLRLQGEAALLAQEPIDLGLGKAQLCRLDFEQSTPCAKPAQPQLGHPARADDELRAARQLIDQLLDQAEHDGALQHLEVVEEQRQRCRMRRHRVDQG